VRIAQGPAAETAASAIGARAFTVGNRIAFGRGEYRPDSNDGRRLIAHELAHVVQQSNAAEATVVRRQFSNPGMGPDMGNTADVVAEREYADGSAPKAQNCGRPSHCPPGFCEPYRSQELAEYYRSTKTLLIMGGIWAAVDSKVFPLWKEYLWGGSGPKNLTAGFAEDFSNSPATLKATEFLTAALQKRLLGAPPVIGSEAYVDIATLIPGEIGALGNPSSPNRMNFSEPRDIPGNLAGDIGLNQTACPAGARPSPYNDERLARGVAAISRTSATEALVSPYISYTVKDTIDLCPGDCGSFVEKFATVPLSQFEATGISGDIPFTVEFPAPSLGAFTIPAPAGPVAPPPKSAPKEP
jgi:hypothetical protein